MDPDFREVKNTEVNTCVVKESDVIVERLLKFSFSDVSETLYGKPLNLLTLKYTYCVRTGRLINMPNV